MNDRYALVQAKKHLAWYIAGHRGCAAGRAKVFTFEEMAALRGWFREFWAETVNQVHEGVASPESIAISLTE